MAFLSKGSRKEDLQKVAIELGVQDVENLKIIDLKKAILEVNDYEEEFVKGFLSSVIEDRKKKEEREERIAREAKEEKIRQEEREERIAREAKEHELEMKRLEQLQKFPEQRNESKVETAPKIQLAQIVPKFDEKRDEMGLFLINFERRAEMAQVPKKDWVAYLLAVLPVEIANMLAREPPEDAINYDFVKTLILKRYKLNSEKLKQCFYRHHKTPEKSWRNYTQELLSYFTEWITELNISTFQQLKDLIVTEQLKFRVPVEIREHFLENWLTFTTPLELAEKLDDYESITDSFKRKEFPKKNLSNSRNQSWNNYSSESKKDMRDGKPKFEPKTEASLGVQREKREFRTKYACFACGKEGHVKKYCPKLNTVRQDGGKTSKSDLEKKGLNAICLNVNIPVEETDGRLLKVDLGIGNQKFQGIIDSGAEITVLRKSVVPEEYLQSCGKVFLRPAIGSPVEAKLVSVPLTLRTEDEVIPYVRVQVAVVEGLHEEALITPKVFALLKEQQKLYLGDEVNITPVEENKEKPVFNVEGRCPEGKLETNLNNEDEDKEASDLELIPTPVEATVLPENVCNEDQKESSSVSQAQLLKKEQLACSTLEKCFEDAKRQKNNYWVESDLLYHRGKVGGQNYVQLVVPACRRQEILRLAHETPTGGHLAAKKTRDRIAMSFWWEGMPKEVKQLCAACHDCQMRRKTKVTDRTPIEAVGRPELPFQVVNADILGPIEPKSSRGHRYVLAIMDQHSRWPEAIPIKSLTAKAACEAFIEIFVRTGIPRMIAMDNGGNFASKLTKELLKRLGCVPKFSTPGYPQSNGLVERWVGTMKSMLHHAINSHGRGWDKQLPFLLWAYREVPNATTGVAPFLLVYGRPPVGPLAILKSSWEDEVVLPQGIGESVADYMQKLRERLKDAAEYSKTVSENQQQRYVHHHNLRSKDTTFSVGDEVVVLIPDSTNKLCSKWKGPGEIVQQKSVHSYAVKLPDGSIRHLHQNKLRKYIQPIRAIGVIYEVDEEFGEVQHAPIEHHSVIDEELQKNINSSNLSPDQQKELVALIQEYRVVFDGELKRAKVGSHSINLKPGVVRKQPHLYKVPETLKANVENQIQELLRKDLIEPSSAEIVYPLVCVAKKDGTIRLCVDYRELNAATKISPFPMQNSDNLKFKAGSAKYLTSLDILKGYWEIPLEESSRELTSFVSPKGQYQWKVMPFGLSGAPATFQRTMNQTLRPHSDYAESFLDDIIIFSSNWEEHLQHIREILETLKSLNFSANLTKCSFAASEVRYLGHIVGSGKHGPIPEKLEVIKHLKAPKTKKGLRSILGLFNYYREYVPHYANLAKPLTDLTRKTVPNDIPWSEDAEKSFNKLKESLCEVTNLYTPDMSKPFEINTDASISGIGACLMQRDKDGMLKPITFASQKLTPTQSKWSTIEREAYAVIWALGRFEMWTYGTTIILHTDHNPLKYLTEGTPKNARLQRWSLALSRYQVSIAHKPGSSNVVADALSRIYE